MELLQIDPIDVLHLRGNRLFAESSHGDAQMPPWPSVFAGALRSRMLVDHGADAAFARGGLDGTLGEVVGHGPDALGSFRLAWVSMTRSGEPLVAAPSDLALIGAPDAPEVVRARPRAVSELGLSGSFPLSHAPLLPLAHPEKTRSAGWLRPQGVSAYLRGEVPSPGDLVQSACLWQLDPRLGIALNAAKRTADEGMLYTTSSVALAPGVGFLTGVLGGGGVLPTGGLLRLGGDGRGASVAACARSPFVEAPWAFEPRGDKFTLWLVTPGLFASGWLPPGTTLESGTAVWRCGSLRARLVAASVPRGEVVSGWDLARNRPKVASRVVPAGSVYWLERVSGELGELQRIREEGLWALEEPSRVDRARRAEGFGSVWMGQWGEDCGRRVED